MKNRPFQVNLDSSDIFCLCEQRKVDGYRNISWRTHTITLSHEIPIGAEVELHIIADPKEPELRVWFNNRVILVAKIQPRQRN